MKNGITYQNVGQGKRVGGMTGRELKERLDAMSERELELDVGQIVHSLDLQLNAWSPLVNLARSTDRLLLEFEIAQFMYKGGVDV